MFRNKRPHHIRSQALGNQDKIAPFQKELLVWGKYSTQSQKPLYFTYVFYLH